MTKPATADADADAVVNIQPIARAVAEFAAALRLEAIPADVVERAQLSLLDSIGIAFVSARLPFAERARRAVDRLGPPGLHPVIGLSRTYGLRDAALLNGLFVHGLDYDDTHIAGIVHPSASALPAALATAVEDHLPGQEFLCGYILGIEVASRLGLASGGGFHAAGFHPTGVVGAFAAATVCAKLRHLGPEAIACAQGFAGSLASGSQQFVTSGAWTKRVHGGWAAQAGIVAAAFAEEAFLSPDEIYEGKFGLYRTHVHDHSRLDLTQIVDGLGVKWAARGVAIKAYPACHFMHAFVDIALKLREEGLRPEDVRRIECRIAPDLIPIVCEPSAAKIRPRSEYDAKFSLPFAVAAGLCRGRLTLAEFDDQTRLDPEILRIAACVQHNDDPHSGYPRQFSGEMLVELQDGRLLHRRRQANRGAPESPLSADDVLAKFHDNLTFAGAPGHATAIVDSVMQVADCGDTAIFARHLTRDG